MNNIHLISTGGTIDKRYNAINGYLDVGSSVMPGIMESAGVSLAGVPISAFLQKDSLDISDTERADLAGFIASASSTRILVTHGTDTMGETAAYIERAVSGKTVVLTGSMVPYEISSVESAFNMGVALSAVRLLPPGVYIAMHGTVLPHAQYQKNRQSGRFVQQ
ncbi:asparaginase domain-containing protein [Propionivibrio sp.]|uniref:asparaginase domain-containing protein n=1 Tax=Propionivibrio sp. TaxID=2212460 RepID=UPI003BF191C3